MFFVQFNRHFCNMQFCGQRMFVDHQVSSINPIRVHRHHRFGDGFTTGSAVGRLLIFHLAKHVQTYGFGYRICLSSHLMVV